MSAELPVLTANDFASDQDPRWCPGCGDYSILAQMKKVLAQQGVARENIVFVSGIGCSSRFPYYMNTYGIHGIHGRAPAIASGLKCSRPDMQVWVITGDGDALSIGGNHFLHTIRRNLDLKVIMFNNRIYGLTKGQYSPTSPLGFKSKTDPWGAIDQPINPMRALLNSGATFIARSHATQVNHMTDMMLRAAKHDGFSVVEILSECVEFFEGAFDAANPRKGGSWSLIDEKKHDGTPEDAKRHDTSDEVAAFHLANQAWPGSFGVFYENKNRKTKNALEAELIAKAKERTKGASDLQLLQSTFAKLLAGRLDAIDGAVRRAPCGAARVSMSLRAAGDARSGRWGFAFGRHLFTARAECGVSRSRLRAPTGVSTCAARLAPWCRGRAALYGGQVLRAAISFTTGIRSCTWHDRGC